MSVYTYTVQVVCDTQEQADQVMAERLGPDEDYGFTYQVMYRFDFLVHTTPRKEA